MKIVDGLGADVHLRMLAVAAACMASACQASTPVGTVLHQSRPSSLVSPEVRARLEAVPPQLRSVTLEVGGNAHGGSGTARVRVDFSSQRDAMTQTIYFADRPLTIVLTDNPGYVCEARTDAPVMGGGRAWAQVYVTCIKRRVGRAPYVAQISRPVWADGTVDVTD